MNSWLTTSGGSFNHMKVSKALDKRRAVKGFDGNHEMTHVDEDFLVNQMLKTPTAFNQQNYRFVVVKDTGLREKIRQAGWDQRQITDASMLVVFCADKKAYSRNPAKYWSHVNEADARKKAEAITNYYEGSENNHANQVVQRDEAVRSASMAAMTLMLSAQEIGYDSCPMIGFDFDKVGDIVRLPDSHMVVMMVAVGKKAIEPAGPGGKINIKEIVFTDTF